MPHYDYECSICGTIEEFFHKMSETPEVECPVCSHVPMRKLISAGAGIIFKGSGFYATDYRTDAIRSTNSGSTGRGEMPYVTQRDIPAIRERVEKRRQARKEADELKARVLAGRR